MFKAGVHWGHRKTNWHPKMEQYIFGVKNNIQIIDLEQTIKGLQNALEFIERMRAALPPDKMKQIEALNFQYRDLQLKGKLLQNRQAALKERARENLRESEAATAAADAAVNSMHR